MYQLERELEDLISYVFGGVNESEIAELSTEQIREQVENAIKEENINGYSTARAYLKYYDCWYEACKLAQDHGYKKIADALNVDLLATIHYRQTLREEFADLSIETSEELQEFLK